MKLRHLCKQSLVISFVFVIACVYAHHAFTASQDEQQKLAHHVVAVFQNHCIQCHGAEKKSGLDLRSRETLLKGGLRGAGLVPGNSKDSVLYQYISGAKSPRMPIGGALEDDDIEAIESWIDKGAVWPAALAIKPLPANFKEKEITAEHRQYWAFVKPIRPEIPTIQNPKSKIQNPIDAFVLAELRKKNLSPAPPADKATLLRRVTFDLTGLPPTPDELKAFLADNSAHAYEKVVDRLLASPGYGERWAQHWLDVVRFAETNGFELDADRPQAWRYRDWVVNALNADKPYDRFLHEQIAGDEIDPTNFDAQVATGFLRAGPQHVVAGNLDKAELRQEYLTETMLGLGSGVLGLTVGCARCHDHKFDPILQSDFYKLQAFFAATDNTDFSNASDAEKEAYKTALKPHEDKLKAIKDQLKAIEKPFVEKLQAEKRSKLEPQYLQALDTPKDKRTDAQKEIAKYAEAKLSVKYEELLMVMPEEVKKPRAALRRQMHDLDWEAPTPLPKALAVADRLDPVPAMYVFRGGEVHSPTREVKPNFPKVLLPRDAPEQTAISAVGKSTGRRTALAKWLTSPDNPLTARVMVNRLWHHHFGRGLVATPNDFGRNGAGVTNQPLLDWLAVEFMNANWGLRNADSNPKSKIQNPKWSLKYMHRLMVTSATYQQSSIPHSAIPNPQFHGANRQRLDSEALRDAILAAAGTLNEQRGGPSIRVPVEPEVVENVFTEGEPDNLWPTHPDVRQHTRRSLYLLRKRNVRLPMLVAFDTPDLMSVCGARNVSVHSLQALTMLNSDFMQEQSKALATRLFREANNERQRIARLYELTLGRAPRADEYRATQTFLKAHAAILRDRNARGETIVAVNNLPKTIDAITAAAWVDLCLATLNLNEFVYVK
jgi:mono/diheme cytochrome c family protein